MGLTFAKFYVFYIMFYKVQYNKNNTTFMPKCLVIYVIFKAFYMYRMIIFFSLFFTKQNFEFGFMKEDFGNMLTS